MKQSISREAAIRIARSKKVVGGAGEYILKVKNTAQNKTHYIINTNCCTRKQLNVFAENMAKDDANAQYELNRCQLSFFQNKKNDSLFKVKKGDFVVVVVERIPTMKGKSSDYRITAVKPLEERSAVPAYELLGETGQLTIAPAEMAKADDTELAVNQGSDIEMPV